MFRYNLLFVLTLFSFGGNGQDLFYSNPIGNYAYAEYKIIGRVQNKIVAYTYVWSHTFDRRNSQILIYNDKMQLERRVSLKPIATKFSSVEFINEGNSFSAILQYTDQKSFVCKLVSFDAEGRILRTRILERSSTPTDGPYQMVQSPGEKTFALLQLVTSDSNTAITIKYHFIKNDTLAHSDQITLPFNRFSSGLERAILDGSNLIVPVNDNTGSSGILYFWKVDLTNNSSINAVSRLTYGYLVSESINIYRDDDKYLLISEWKYHDADRSKVFLWQLNKDLTDATPATIFDGPDTSNTCLRKMTSFNLTTTVLKNKTTNIILSSRKSNTIPTLTTYNYPGPPAAGYGGRGGSGSFYAGRVSSMTPRKNLNGNGVESEAHVREGEQYPYPTENVPANTNYVARDPMTSKAKIENGALTIWNLDQKNNIRWTQCFDETIEKDFRSSVNRATIAQSENSTHIIFLKALKNNKQALGHIVLQPGGTYKIIPIISMNLEYLYFPDKSSQIDLNTVIIPCASNGKLVFAKFKLDEN